jgi:FG-GAP repeat protein
VGANRDQGAVYVFQKPASGWHDMNQTAELTASNGAADDGLGSAVAISGDTVVASAPTAQVGTHVQQGEADVFVEPAGGWRAMTQTGILRSSDGGARVPTPSGSPRPTRPAWPRAPGPCGFGSSGSVGRMFGGRRRRVERLSAGAARNLEPGETVRELVQVQTGQAAMANATAVMRSELVSARGIPYVAKVNAGPHILVATDRNLYAMTLSGARLYDVGDVVLKVPLAEAGLERAKRQLMVGGTTFHVMIAFADHAEALYEHVRAAGGASAAAR